MRMVYAVDGVCVHTRVQDGRVLGPQLISDQSHSMISACRSPAHTGQVI